jgi:uncharacterized protein (TIGR02391 family)
MVKQATNQHRPLAKLSLEEMKNAILKIDRGLQALTTLNINSISCGTDPQLVSLSQRLGKIITDIFGNDTHEYYQYNPFTTLTYINLSLSRIPQNDSPVVKKKIEQAIVTFTSIKEGFIDELQDLNDSSESIKATQAYEGLNLHLRIANAASELFKNKHYANAIGDAVKALCELIREKTELDTDGVALMQTAFSSKNPILQFNQLKDQSDMDEQRGFMEWFTGTIFALRNPRAHKLISDEPEMALEFIAFVSLLAKLVDKSSLNPRNS